MAADIVGAANLLVGLHHWAARQDENFLTEAFVHLLRYDVVEEAEAALQLLNRITEGRLEVTAEDLPSVEVCTQTVTELGRPDVEIRMPGHLVYIEAKVESGLGVEQLKRYRQALQASPNAQTTLVLLSRYSIGESEVSAPPDVWIRWFEIGDLLMDQIEHGMLEAVVSRYLAQQFVGFLRSKGMLMDQIGWQLPAGIGALTSLMGLLGEAIDDVGIVSRKSSGWTWMGYGLDKDRKFWTGVLFDAPHLLSFTTDQIKIDPVRWGDLGVGRVEKASWLEGGYRWRSDLDLQSEAVHFFARSRSSQQQTLEKFVRENVELAMGALQAQEGE